MGRYNLLDEKWISVVVNEKGNSEKVSLKDVFENAHKYADLAGDTETQDFAVLRVLLAVVQTVFSRLDAEGNPYDFIELDERYKPINEMDLEDEELDEYKENLMQTWLDIWKQGKYSSVIVDYLEKWRDRFYLFDDKFPFFQVTKDDFITNKVKKGKPTTIYGKNFNRLITESENKKALFSPKNDQKNNKDILNEDQIVRWLICFQSYTGTGDKSAFDIGKYKFSIGWLYDIGGVYFKGKNLFETLMLNTIVFSDDNSGISFTQKPCWEASSGELVRSLLRGHQPDNLAELYTAWSRAIYINPHMDVGNRFICEIVKLPEINHQDQFLEPMTLWKYNKLGENKGKFTPKKHQASSALWRSFGLLTDYHNKKNKDQSHNPEIMDWLAFLKENDFIENRNIKVCAVSMESDNNATSWVPVDEIIDKLLIDDYVLTDLQENGWVIIINDEVDKTKYVVEQIYYRFVNDIKEIRNIQSSDFIEKKKSELYFKIDQPFKEWISSISMSDSKDKKIIEWRKVLKSITVDQAKHDLESANSRDYIGIETKGGIKNIATAYNSFIQRLNKEIGEV